jgi:cobalamin biosynthesis protein CobD/CbiB
MEVATTIIGWWIGRVCGCGHFISFAPGVVATLVLVRVFSMLLLRAAYVAGVVWGLLLAEIVLTASSISISELGRDVKEVGVGSQTPGGQAYEPAPH